MARLVGVGLSALLCGFLVLLIPHDTDSIAIQLAVSLFIAGFLLLWLGLLARL